MLLTQCKECGAEWEAWARLQLMAAGSDLLGKFSNLQVILSIGMISYLMYFYHSIVCLVDLALNGVDTPLSLSLVIECEPKFNSLKLVCIIHFAQNLLVMAVS